MDEKELAQIFIADALQKSFNQLGIEGTEEAINGLAESLYKDKLMEQYKKVIENYKRS